MPVTHRLSYTVTDLGYDAERFNETRPGTGYGQPNQPCLTEVTVRYEGDDPDGVETWEVCNDRDPFGEKVLSVYGVPLCANYVVENRYKTLAAEDQTSPIQIVSKTSQEIVIRNYWLYSADDAPTGQTWNPPTNDAGIAQPSDTRYANDFLMVGATTHRGDVEAISIQAACPQLKVVDDSGETVHTKGQIACPPKVFRVESTRAGTPAEECDAVVVVSLRDCRETENGGPLADPDVGDTCCAWNGTFSGDVDSGSISPGVRIRPSRIGPTWDDPSRLRPTHELVANWTDNGLPRWEVKLGGKYHDAALLAALPPDSTGLFGEDLRIATQPPAEIDLSVTTAAGTQSVRAARYLGNKAMVTPSTCCRCCGCQGGNYQAVFQRGSSGSFTCNRNSQFQGTDPFIGGTLPPEATTVTYRGYDFIGYRRVGETEILSDISGHCGTVLGFQHAGMGLGVYGISPCEFGGYILSCDTPADPPVDLVDYTTHDIDSTTSVRNENNSDGSSDCLRWDAGNIKGPYGAAYGPPCTNPRDQTLLHEFPVQNPTEEDRLRLKNNFNTFWNGPPGEWMCVMGSDGSPTYTQTGGVSTVLYDSSGNVHPEADRGFAYFGLPYGTFSLGGEEPIDEIIYRDCTDPKKTEHIAMISGALGTPSTIYDLEQIEKFVDGVLQSTTSHGGTSPEIELGIITSCRLCANVEIDGSVSWEEYEL